MTEIDIDPTKEYIEVEITSQSLHALVGSISIEGDCNLHRFPREMAARWLRWDAGWEAPKGCNNEAQGNDDHNDHQGNDGQHQQYYHNRDDHC